ncbi:MAG TPA: SMP-30/gluconolactonase/LRE family protein [Anaerolineales bacterium]|nr:SMP-30/gluconolactonase/LRE family protein [Anaerolineales bacterium]
MNIELLYDSKATLGEGPIWDARTQTLYWLDILNKRIYAQGDLLAEQDEFIGCMAPRRNGGLILAKRFSFASLEVDSGRSTLILYLTDEPSHNRFNDGKCDPRGRFLAGTMDMNETDPNGSLYSFDGKSVNKILGDITISNGMAWSPDYKTFYYIDTPTRTVRAFDYDLETGAIANPRAAIYVPEALGWPDGMTSDTQGNLWIAMWGGAKLTKWNPNTGQLLEQIPVPALNVSSCVFGGKNMNELYITSARKGLDEAVLAKYPLTGGVFRLETNVEGLPTFEFAG